MNVPFQRKGAVSNTQVGIDFEKKVKTFFESIGLRLDSGVTVDIGINGTKSHRFDLGNLIEKILVECKSHMWTEGKNVPSAKMTTWNQAMYYFQATPPGYKKILCVLKDFSPSRKMTLAQYYLRTNAHMIPLDVEIWEFDEDTDTAKKIN